MRALWDELVTYPKPGLVSLVDSGSHSDMNAKTFGVSIFSLRRYFYQMAELGRRNRNFEQLKHAGIEAESEMLIATDGVNTHRGAIFILGILVAAAAYRNQYAISGLSLGDLAVKRWGVDLLNHRKNPNSNGSIVNQTYRVSGAVEEVTSGYKSVYKFALPVYRSVIKNTGSARLARIQSFFTLMAKVVDTNILHRGGLSGLQSSQNLANAFLELGGIYARDWENSAVQIHNELIKLNISPGGCADLLGACIFINQLENE